MAYIEENMKLRRGAKDEEKKDEGPADPYAELFRLTKAAQKKEEEGKCENKSEGVGGGGMERERTRLE